MNPVLITGQIETRDGVTVAHITMMDSVTKVAITKRFESTCPDMVFMNLANFYSEAKRNG